MLWIFGEIGVVVCGGGYFDVVCGVFVEIDLCC